MSKYLLILQRISPLNIKTNLIFEDNSKKRVIKQATSYIKAVNENNNGFTFKYKIIDLEELTWKNIK